MIIKPTPKKPTAIDIIIFSLKLARLIITGEIDIPQMDTKTHISKNHKNFSTIA